MKKSLYLAVWGLVFTFLFNSCTNEEVVQTGMNNEYKSNFEKVFGQVSPAQNFNSQRTVTIDASMVNAQGSYTLRVYDGHPGMEGTSLLGKFENLSSSAVSTVKVGASKSSKSIYCVADNGTSRRLTTAAVPTSGRVTAKFDTADGAPTGEVTDAPTSVTIAFEDLGSTDDFDFNDAVIRVDYVTGTGEADVTLMAVGASFSLKLYYAVTDNNYTPLFEGRELHDVMGCPNTMINTNWTNPLGNSLNGADNVNFVTRRISVPENFFIGDDSAPLVLEVNVVERQRQLTSLTQHGAIPQVFVVGKYHSVEKGKTFFWRWPKERVRLNLAFPNIDSWMTDPTDLSFLADGVEDNLYDGYDPTVVETLVRGIELSPNVLTLRQNSSSQLTAIVTPTDATDPSLVWSSSDESIATVADGLVTAVAVGTAVITCTAADGSGVNASCTVTVYVDNSGEINGRQYVDLGLPSGTLWAATDVGASSPGQKGKYFAWAEITGYDYQGRRFTWGNYRYVSGGNPNIYLTKYCYSSALVQADNKTVLDLSDDAAYRNWGAGWCMPSPAQWTELLTECTFTSTTLNNVKGCNAIGPNGNSIFLPYSGCCYDTAIENSGLTSFYWTNSLYTGSQTDAFFFMIGGTPASGSLSNRARCYGMTIRPVRSTE